jgi:hypothetical protein
MAGFVARAALQQVPGVHGMDWCSTGDRTYYVCSVSTLLNQWLYQLLVSSPGLALRQVLGVHGMGKRGTGDWTEYQCCVSDLLHQ